MKYLYLICLISFSFFRSVAQPLRIAVAANAQFVAEKLKEEFKKETGIDAQLTISSSGKLTSQIEQGAPFDVFLSADMKYPNELYKKGFTAAKPAVYAYGTLVVWTLKNINLTNGLAQIISNDVQKIAIANPKLAPYGEAAIQALTKKGLLSKAQPKIVYGESISQVNQYLLPGAADVAFTAKSVVLDNRVANRGKWIEIDSSLYNPIAQGAVVIRTAAANKAAQNFYQFLFSKPAKAIFIQYGYK